MATDRCSPRDLSSRCRDTYSTLKFFVPAGGYTATLQIPAFYASLDEQVKLDHGSVPDADTGLEQHDPGCVRVADSAAQQKP